MGSDGSDGSGYKHTELEAYGLGAYSLGVYNLRVYRLELPILDLVSHTLVHNKNVGGPFNVHVV